MSLLCLPTELVEHITSHIDIQSFRSFRLVCASLTLQALQQFQDRFFRKHTLVWNEESFHGFLKLTSHPYLSNSIRELVINATPRYAIRLWELGHEMQHALRQQDFGRRDALRQELRDLQEIAVGVAREWNETRSDQKMLGEAFAKLKDLQSIRFAYDGMESHVLFAHRYCESSQNEMSRPFVSTMAAMAASGLTVQSITVDPTKRYGAVSIGRLESMSPVFSKLHDAFQKLATLRLDLRDWRYPEAGFEPPVGRIPFIVRFLAKFKNVRTLDLSCFSCLEEDIFTWVAQHCKFPRLETCRLELFAVRVADDLLKFLSPARASLRSLHLDHIALKESSANEATVCAGIMRRIAGEFSLEKIEFSTLFAHSGARLMFGVPPKGTLVLETPNLKEKVDECMETLVIGSRGLTWHLAAALYPFRI